MAIANVACPHCREQTAASIPGGECGVTAVRAETSHDANDGTADCSVCGKEFGYEFLCQTRVGWDQALQQIGKREHP